MEFSLQKVPGENRYQVLLHVGLATLCIDQFESTIHAVDHVRAIATGRVARAMGCVTIYDTPRYTISTLAAPVRA